ncbi:MAG: class I SAM-dependent methyltransferase [Alphaproteobacteria bacterium]
MDKPALVPFDPDAVIRSLARGQSRLPPSRLRGLAVQAGERLLERLQDLSLSFSRPVDFASHSSLNNSRWAAKNGDLSPLKIPADSLRIPENLTLRENSADLIVSHLSLHTVNDLQGILVSLRRSLSPNGLLLASLAGPRTLSTLRRVLVEAESRVTGGISARVAPFPNMEDLGRLILGAGFTLPVLDRDIVRAKWPFARDLMHELRDEGVTNSLTLRSRTFSRREIFSLAETLWQESGGEEEFEVIYVTAWSPGPDQQHALTPGSAQKSLAEALNSDITDESIH